MPQPLRATEAKALIRRLLSEGEVLVWNHAAEEMAKDALSMVDIENVLRGGVVEEAEFVNGSGRHRVRTQRIYVVVQFPDEDLLEIVTAWRILR